jgi:uracil-DNA glycosylase
MALDRLLRDIARCRLCVDRPRGISLPHEPRPVLQVARSARLLIAGQAPGARVHLSGKPFTDPSGDRLRAWLEIDEETFYDATKVAILPMGLCFPGLSANGADLPPRRECAPAWRGPLLAELREIRLILAVGLHAQRWHLGPSAGAGMTATVENWRQGLECQPPVIPLPHPSWRNTGWLKRHPWFTEELLPELRRRVHLVLA